LPTLDQSTLTFPRSEPPAPGEVVEIAPGILWARMPMPMALDHINVYLLRDHDGWILVDTGLNTDAARRLWEVIANTHLQGLPVKAVLCTHYHYDHAGLAHWLTAHFDVPLYMTHGEYFMMRMTATPPEDSMLSANRDFFMRAGMPDEIIQRMMAAIHTDPFRGPAAAAFRRLRGGDEMRIGARRWRVVIGEGHSPEHACLYCEEDRILIAGDQLLPRISSNVAVSCIEPEANPLQLWLDSLDRLDQLAPETLVLPSHQRVYRGLRARVQELREHHAHEFDVVRAFVDGSGNCTAYEAMQCMFPHVRSPIDYMLGLGEAIAHLSWLRYQGSIRRVLDDDGVYKFSVAHEELLKYRY
jgi:glyoxylase-like metal-dependent hydrolase (beta-lactamase superfamily II)